MNSSLFTLNPYARVREEHYRGIINFNPRKKKSIRARARGAFGRVWIYRVGRVDYPCVSGALRDVYNGVETPPFKPYLYAHVREEKLLLVAANREKRDIHTCTCARRNPFSLCGSAKRENIHTRACAGRNAVLPISIVSTRDIHTRTSRGGEVAVVL